MGGSLCLLLYPSSLQQMHEGTDVRVEPSQLARGTLKTRVQFGEGRSLSRDEDEDAVADGARFLRLYLQDYDSPLCHRAAA